MNLLFKSILTFAIASSILLGGIVFGLQQGNEVVPQSLGGFTPVGTSSFTLAGAGINATQTTIQLTSFTLPDPNKTPITMSMFGSIGYGVLEPQSSKIEDISFTGVTQNVNGTATLSGVVRGMSFYSPYAGSTTLAVAHAGGANFIISNTAGFYGQQFLFANNAGSSTATITYSNTAPPFYYPGPGAQSTGSAIATTSEFASIAYVNAISTGGAPNASASVKGIVQLATAAQAALGTILGSTGASLVLPASLATSTPYNSGSNVIPVTGTNEKLSQAFLDLTQAFNVSGLWTFGTGFISQASSTLNATTTIAASSVTNKALVLNGIPYAFPASQGAGDSSLINNGSGTLSWGNTSTYSLIGNNLTVNNGYATSSSLSIPANLMTGSSTIYIQVNGTCGHGTSSGTCTIYLRNSTGATYWSCSDGQTGTSITFSQTMTAVVANQGAVNVQSGAGNLSSLQLASIASSIIGSCNQSATVDSSQAQNLVMVVNGSTSNITPNYNFLIVVHP